MVLRRLLEASVLLLVVVSPWLLAGAEPICEFILYVGLLVVLALTSGVAILERGYRWSHCPLLVFLTLLSVVCLTQLLPLPRAVLSWLAPGTAQLYTELLPSRSEVLPLGQRLDQFWPPAGSSLSLYPHATRQGLVRLLGALLLFYVVRNYAASAGFLRRVSILAVANGACLSLFALLQFFAAPQATVYWQIPTLGQPFGPFVCKNHFPFYINICIGLGLGLILYELGYHWRSRQPASSRSPAPHPTQEPLAKRFARRSSPMAPAWSWLERSPVLWVSLSLTLMIGAVALSLSRGGLLSLAVTSLVCLLIHGTRSTGMRVLQATVVLLGTSLALVNWLGSERVERRMSTVYSGEAFQEGRLPLWSRSLTLLGDFPVWGAGLGTFQFVEPLSRRQAVDANTAYDHAHNDYVEALVEGGLLRLGLTLALIVFMYRLGYRALVQLASHPTSGLVMGSLMGLTTVVIHSFGDFGIHMPAITILVIVVSAQLAALAGPEGRASPPVTLGQRGSPTSSPERLSPAVSLVAGVTLLGVAIVGCHEGWKKQAVKSRQVVADPLGAANDLERRQVRIDVIEGAVRSMPTDALLRAELAQAHLGFFQDAVQELDRLSAATPEEQEMIDSGGAALIANHLVVGLKHLVAARNLCPILPDAQTFLAANVERFERADSLENYLHRAKRLLPGDAAAWFLFGQQELLAETPKAAWQSWRYCLQLSDSHLAGILDVASERLSPPQLLQSVLPDRPEVLLAAAIHRYPATDQREAGPLPMDERRLILEHALRLLESSSDSLTAAQGRIKARLLQEMGEPVAALTAYRFALEREPQQTEWRFEMAQLLANQGQEHEATQEVRRVLARQPGHAGARQLLESLTASSKPSRQ